MSIRVNNGNFKINSIAKAVLTFIPPTPTATVGTTPTPTPSLTAQPTSTQTPTQTATPTTTTTLTATQTQTPTNTTTQTPTTTTTLTATPTQTATQPLTPSVTTTQTQTPTATSNLTSSGLIGFDGFIATTIPTGFDSPFDACSGTTAINTSTAYWNGTLGNDTTLYSDSKGLNPFVNSNLGFFYYSGLAFNLDVSTVYNSQSCLVVTPTQTSQPTPTVTQTPTPTTPTAFNFILLPIDTECYNYNYVNNSGSSSILRYVDCTGGAISTTVINGGSGTFCGQRGAYVSSPSNSITVTESTSCGVFQPTPTQTPSNTPTPTIGNCVTCLSTTFDGNITHASLTAYWTDCNTGLPQSYFVNADTTYGPVCAVQGSASGQAFTTGAGCGNTCPTPTITQTQTQTPTPTATPFPYSGFQTSAFSSNAISQTTGQYQVIAESGDFGKSVYGYLFVSNNYGANFLGLRLQAYWQNVSVSDDGRYMLACGIVITNGINQGRVYKSSDYGVTWSQIATSNFPGYPNTTLKSENGIYVKSSCISNDGKYQVLGTDLCLVLNQGYTDSFYGIYVSSDYGNTWTLPYYNNNASFVEAFYSTTISSNGQLILAMAGNGPTGPSYGEIYRSTNYGANFALVTGTTKTAQGSGISVSRDGSKVIASYFNSTETTQLSYSTNSGSTWTNITSGSSPSRQWSKVAIYNDATSGTTAYATTSTSGNIVRVVNIDSTPSVVQVSPSKTARGLLSVSNSGQYIIVRDTVGIWRSANSGTTFNYITS